MIILPRQKRLLVTVASSLATIAIALVGILGGSYTLLVVYQTLLMLAVVLVYNLFGGATGYLSFARGAMHGVGGYAAVIAASLLHPVLGPFVKTSGYNCGGFCGSAVLVVAARPLASSKGSLFCSQ